MSDQNSLPNLVIYVTPQGRTVRLEETCPQPLEAPSPQLAALPFQKGAPLDPLGSKQDQEIKDLYREILMVRISKLHESDDDSMECVNLDDYNSNDYNKYLSDNMEATPSAIIEVKTTIEQDPPAALPAGDRSTGGRACSGGSLRASSPA